jgi:hypothetical protein
VPSVDDVERLKSETEDAQDRVTTGIANGHALGKHGAEDFGIDDPEELKTEVNQTIDGATNTLRLRDNRTVYYDARTNTLVIVDPSSQDNGSVYRPPQGKSYLKRFRKDMISGNLD